MEINKIIYFLRSLLFMRIFYILFLITVIGYSAKAQPGAIDPGFDPGTGANTDIMTTSIQSDGKIIIGGNFFTYNEIPRKRIARLNADGTLDSTFNPGIGPNDWIDATAVQSDGKVIIGGLFDHYNWVESNHIARLNSDGTLDNTFNTGTGTNGIVFAISIQSDGKIIIAGDFTTYNGTPKNYIARLNTDGTLDAGFNNGSGPNDCILSMVTQNDGKIIIGGGFSSYNGSPRVRIARLNANGTLDVGFNPGTGADQTINATAIQNDGKVIIGGHFTSYNGIARNYIARLNTNGTLDLSFDTGSGPSDCVYSIGAQNDGKIIIGGNFLTYNGSQKKMIARLNTNGTIDDSFVTGTGINGTPLAIAIQNDGKIIVVGLFTLYNGTGRNRIARLLVGNSGISSLQSKNISIYPNPVSNELNIEIEGNNTPLNYEILNLYGKVLFKGNFIEKTTLQIADFTQGVYLVKVGNDKSFEIKKIIKE